MTWVNLWNCQQPWHDTFGQSWALLQETPPSLSHPAAAAAAAAAPASIDQHKLFPLKACWQQYIPAVYSISCNSMYHPYRFSLYLAEISEQILCIVCCVHDLFFFKSVAHTNYITVKGVSADILIFQSTIRFNEDRALVEVKN